MPTEVKITKKVSADTYSAAGTFYPRKGVENNAVPMPVELLVQQREDGKAELLLNSGLQESTIGGYPIVALHFAEEAAVPVPAGGLKVGVVLTFERVIFAPDMRAKVEKKSEKSTKNRK